MGCAFHPNAEALYKCIDCGKDICEACRVAIKDEDHCKACVASKIQGGGKAERSPALAALLSFFIGGAGQIYNGQTGKGIFIFLTSFLIIPWIYGIFDAHSTAKKINSGKIVFKRGAGCLAAIAVFALIIFIMVPILALLAAIAIPNFMKARQDTLKKMKPVVIDVAGMEERIAESDSGPAPEAPRSISAGNRDIYKVRLKNGMVFEAQIEKEGTDFYVFRVGNGTFDARESEIEEMKRLE